MCVSAVLLMCWSIAGEYSWLSCLAGCSVLASADAHEAVAAVLAAAMAEALLGQSSIQGSVSSAFWIQSKWTAFGLYPLLEGLARYVSCPGSLYGMYLPLQAGCTDLTLFESVCVHAASLLAQWGSTISPSLLCP